MKSVVDVPALATSILIAAAITAALLYSFRDGSTRRAWLASAALAVALVVLGAADIFLRPPPREQQLSAVIFGAAITVLGALGLVRGTRPIRLRYRAPLVFITTLALFLGSILFAAAYVSRLLPF